MKSSALMLAALISLLTGRAESSECAGGTTVPLTLEKTGAVSVKVSLAAKNVRMIVSTGHPLNVLASNTAKALRLHLTSGEGDEPGTGKAWGVVEVNRRELGTQPFAVINDSYFTESARIYATEPLDGLLGAPFFLQYKARIDFESMSLCLKSIP